MIREDGNNIFFPDGYVFHKSFVNRFKRDTVITARRKLRGWYGRSMQDHIIRYLRDKNIITRIH